MAASNSTVGTMKTYTLSHCGRVLDTFQYNTPAWLTASNLGWQFSQSIPCTLHKAGVEAGEVQLFVEGKDSPILTFVVEDHTVSWTEP
jgi:hypothetical protein